MGKKKILSGEYVLEFDAFWGTKVEAGKDNFFPSLGNKKY